MEGYKEEVRIAVLKKDETVLKVEETEELLSDALEANTRAEERIKTLEAEVVDREKAAFDQGWDEAQTIMTKQLPSVYNEAFHEGWKTLYAWPESEDIPELPPRENLPYPDAPIGVPEEEVSAPLPHPIEKGEDGLSST